MFSLNCSLKLVRLSSQLNRLNLLHSTSLSRVQVDFRNENVYYKQIYSDDLQFQRLEPLFKTKKVVEDQNLVSFKNVVNTAEITNSNLVPYFKEFTNSLKNKDDDSLIFVLNRLRKSRFKFMSPTVHNLILFIDQNLADNLAKEGPITNERFETLFQVALLLDEIGLQSWSKFINKLIMKAIEDFSLFESKENLLRLIYVWNLSRRTMNSEKAMLIELQVMKLFHYNQLDLKELSLICVCFHKTQTKFQTQIVEHITEKLIDELDTVKDPLCVASILKGIFSSEHKIEMELLDKLFNKLMDSPFSSNFLVLTRFLAIKKKYKSYNERVITTVIDSFLNQDKVRIKELSRLLLTLLFFDVQLNSKQIGKFNEQFEKIKSTYAVYRVEYLLSVYALATHGLIRKEEIFNIYDPEFIKILRTKYSEITYFLMNLNNILKLYGDSNYKDVALKDRDILKMFKNFDSISKSEVYARFKKFEHYSSKLYLCYQTLKDSLEGRVHLVHILPGCKYPHIVITPKKTVLKDYPFEVSLHTATGLSIVRLPGPETICDKETRKVNGYYKLENDLLSKMGFKLFELDNHLISHTSSELKLYLNEQVLDHLN